IKSRLERSIFGTEQEADLVIEGRIESSPGAHGFYAVIVTRRPDGTPLGKRELRSESEDCRTFDGALTLVIALIIDQNASARREALVGSASAQIRKTAAPMRVAVVPTRATQPWRFGAELSALTGFGILPTPNLGVTGGIAFQPPGWPFIEIAGSLWL